MNRLRALTIGGAVLAALILGVFAYLIADAQSEDKEDVEKRFRDVAQVSAAGHERDLRVRLPEHADSGRPRTSRGRSTSGRLRSSQRRGRRSTWRSTTRTAAGWAPLPAPRSRGPPSTPRARPGSRGCPTSWARAEDATIEFAIPYETPSGRRIFVTGSPTKPFADFLAASLGDLPTEFGDDAETAMVDSNGVVLGGDNLSSPPGEKLDDPDLLEALQNEDIRRLRRRPLLRVEPDHQLAVQDRPRHVEGRTSTRASAAATVSWIIFAAFALALFGGLFVLAPRLATAAELRAARAERAPRGRDQRQHHPGAGARQVQARKPARARRAQTRSRRHCARRSGSCRACSATPRSRQVSCGARSPRKRRDRSPPPEAKS